MGKLTGKEGVMKKRDLKGDSSWVIGKTPIFIWNSFKWIYRLIRRFILHKKQLSSQAPYGHNKNPVRALECVVPDAGQNHLEAGGFHFSRVDDFFEFV